MRRGAASKTKEPGIQTGGEEGEANTGQYSAKRFIIAWYI